MEEYVDAPFQIIDFLQIFSCCFQLSVMVLSLKFFI